MGAYCCGDGKKREPPLHPQLEGPPLYVVIGGLVGVYAGVSGLLSFTLGPSALVISVLLVVLFAMVVVPYYERNHPTMHWIILLCVATAAIATVAGISNYHQLYSKYLSAELGREYKDVSPQAKASAHADGGVITFSADAALDDTRAVGILSFGRVYCVAPIVSFEASVAPHHGGPAVQFWAVGTDCCRKRSSFECDSAGDAASRGAIVLHEGEEAVTSSFLKPHMHEPEYLRAIKAASALFEMESADPPVLVRWVKNTEEMVDNWRIAAILFWVLSCVCHCIVVTGVWCFVHKFYEDKISQATRKLGHGVGAPEPNITGSRPRKDPFLLNAGGGAAA